MSTQTLTNLSNPHLCPPSSEKQSVVISLIAVSNKLNLALSMGFPGGSDGKESAGSAGDPGSIPGSGLEDGYPLQYSCLESSMDRGAWS